MMNQLRLKINGKNITAYEGMTILEVARENGIYIPTLCYLKKVLPIASCRVCVVHVEGEEGLILSCQTPIKEGMEVITRTPFLEKERQKIYQLYAINHPLECGVCDKSGECELQNGILEFGVDKQKFCAKEQPRSIKNWGLIQYDPNLCILCERCVHICNEVIGDDAIGIKAGGYNSHIIPKNGEKLSCTMCGECVAVCPVGALISTNFKYQANAWEMKRVPSVCFHCSSGCTLFYETKYKSTYAENEQKIYRVTHDYDAGTLCGAGRFGFDYGMPSAKDEKKFHDALNAFKEADTIVFTSMISNETALLLQRLKKELGYKLINNEAKRYQESLNAYRKITGKYLYSATLEDVQQSDFVICLGTTPTSDNPVLRYALTAASKYRHAEIVYMHPLEDNVLSSIVTQYVKYEVGTEEGVAALLALMMIGDCVDLSDLDEGYLSGETSLGEEEVLRIAQKAKTSTTKTLIIGEDIISHNRHTSIIELLSLLEVYGGFRILLLPKNINTLGVALLCSLDDKVGNNVIGYETHGDFILSSCYQGENVLKVSSLLSQSGTITNTDKRVIPFKNPLQSEEYTLKDIAYELNITLENDLTYELGVIQGYQYQPFDTLFSSNISYSGYLLSNSNVLKEDFILKEIDDLPEFNGIVIYECNPVLQFNEYTAQSSHISQKNYLYGSKQFAQAAKISDGDRILIKNNSKNYETMFKIEPTMKGTIGMIGSFDSTLSENVLFSGYRFSTIRIEKVMSNG